MKGAHQYVSLVTGTFRASNTAESIGQAVNKGEAVERAWGGALPGSHTWREVRAVFNQFPKTELFYADVSDLKPAIDRVWDDTIASIKADLAEWLRHMQDPEEMPWVPEAYGEKGPEFVQKLRTKLGLGG